MTARRHHFISQCYLKSFAVPRKGKAQIHVFDREQRKSFLTATDNVALERDFNRVKFENTEPDAFEQVLAEFEADLAPALVRTIQAAAFQSDNDRTLIFNFIAWLAIHNPRHRENIRDLHEQLAKSMLGLSLQTKERWESQEKKVSEAGFGSDGKTVTYEEMKAYYKEDKYSIDLKTEYHIDLALQSFNAVLPYIFERGWMIMKVPHGSGGFVTSDHPVSLMWSKPEMRGGVYSPGFGLKGTQVVFPLSPKVALAGAFGLRNETREVSEEIIAGVNGYTSATASRQVYARDLNFHYMFDKGAGIRKASRLIDDQMFRPKEEMKARAAEERKKTIMEE